MQKWKCTVWIGEREREKREKVYIINGKWVIIWRE